MVLLKAATASRLQVAACVTILAALVVGVVLKTSGSGGAVVDGQGYKGEGQIDRARTGVWRGGGLVGGLAEDSVEVGRGLVGKSSAVLPADDPGENGAGTAGIEGLVVDDRGEPITLFHLSIRDEATGTREDRWVSNGEGEFSMTMDAPGMWRVVVSSEGYTSCVLDVEGASLKSLRAVLFRAGAMTVCVEDGEGWPISGARVSAGFSSRHPFSTEPLPMALTDAGGCARLGSLPLGEFCLAVDADGYARGKSCGFRVLRQGDELQAVIRLAQGGTVVGSLAECGYGAVEGTEVWLWPLWSGDAYGETGPSEYKAGCDAEGRFAVSNVRAGWYRARARLIGTEGASAILATAVRVVDSQRSEVNFCVQREAAVSVRGSLLFSGVALPSGRVTLSRSDSISSESKVAVKVSQDGAFEVQVPGEGVYSVQVWGKTDGGVGLSMRSQVSVPQCERFDMDLEVEVGAIRGRVVNAAGEGVGGVMVFASGTSGSGAGRHFVSADSVTSVDGGFTFDALPLGEYGLVARGVAEADGSWDPNSPGQKYAAANVSGVVCVRGEEARCLRLVLPDASRITGVVEAWDGRVVPFAAIEVASLAGVVQSGRISEVCDSEGVFEVSGLEAGEYLVRARLGELASEWVAVRLLSGMEASCSLGLNRGGWIEIVSERNSSHNQAMSFVVEHPCGVEWDYQAMAGGVVRIGPLVAGEYGVRVNGARDGDSEVPVPISVGVRADEVSRVVLDTQ